MMNLYGLLPESHIAIWSYGESIKHSDETAMHKDHRLSYYIHANNICESAVMILLFVDTYQSEPVVVIGKCMHA